MEEYRGRAKTLAIQKRERLCSGGEAKATGAKKRPRVRKKSRKREGREIWGKGFTEKRKGRFTSRKRGPVRRDDGIEETKLTSSNESS